MVEIERAYQRWGDDETSALIGRICNGESIENIAGAHSRSMGAIRSRIARLYNEGRIEIMEPFDVDDDWDEEGAPCSNGDGLPSPDCNILIIGAGGIGGLLTHHVARAVAFSGLTEEIGVLRLTLMDGDEVEERNLPHQPFCHDELRGFGPPAKVDSIWHDLVYHVGVKPSLGVQIVPINENFTYDGGEEGDISKYDLVVVAVDRPEPRWWVHWKAEQWLDLRARGDGFVMWSHEDDYQILDSLPTLPPGESTSCQLEDAVEMGNIQFGFALAAAHGAQWIIQWLRKSQLPPNRMSTIHMGELQLPEFPKGEVE